MGFSVMGRVLNGVDGEGVPDATVTLNNQIKGKTTLLQTCRSIHFGVTTGHVVLTVPSAVLSKEDGSFRLENMTAGTYTIRVSKELMFFESVTVKIAPNTPQLPDIITAGWGHSSQTYSDFKNGFCLVDSHLFSPLHPLTQVQCVWPDLHQPSARGHEAAGPLQGHLEAPRPRENLQQDH